MLTFICLSFSMSIYVHVYFISASFLKVPSHCCDLSCNVVASRGRSGIACSWPGVVLRSHNLAIGLL